MLWLKLSKDVSARSKAENKGKKEKGTPKDCAAKWLGCVLSPLNYRRWEQDGQEQESGDKGTGGGWAGYRKREILTPLLSWLTDCRSSVNWVSIEMSLDCQSSVHWVSVAMSIEMSMESQSTLDRRCLYYVHMNLKFSALRAQRGVTSLDSLG